MSHLNDEDEYDIQAESDAHAEHVTWRESQRIEAQLKLIEAGALAELFEIYVDLLYGRDQGIAREVNSLCGVRIPRVLLDELRAEGRKGPTWIRIKVKRVTAFRCFWEAIEIVEILEPKGEDEIPVSILDHMTNPNGSRGQP